MLRSTRSLAGTHIPSAFNHGVGDRSQTCRDHQRSEGDVEPHVHGHKSAGVVHHTRLKIAAEELRNTVEQTGIANHGDHGVHRHHAGHKTRQQVEVANQPGNLGLDKPQIQRQQISQNDGLVPR